MNVVLDDLTAGWLEWEDCPMPDELEDNPSAQGNGVCGECDGSGRILPDQWLPLRELLMVPCPQVGRESDDKRWCGDCDGTGCVLLPEGVYDIGTERTEVCTWTADGERRQLETTWFVPLALGVHLRQVEWEKVVRCTCDEEAEFTGIDQPHPDHIKTVSQENLYLSADLYDRLAVSVDGGPPAGVLNVRAER